MSTSPCGRYTQGRRAIRRLTDEDAERNSPAAITGFNTTSVGVEFTILADVAYQTAESTDIEVEIPTELFTQGPSVADRGLLLREAFEAKVTN